VVDQGLDQPNQRHLIAPVLGRGGGEGAADFADQRALGPQPAGLVEEVAHLAGGRSVARTRADDDGVIAGELVHGRDRGVLVQLVAALSRQLFGHQFRHALHVHDRALDLARALRDGLGHFLDVAIGGVIENQNLRHDALRMSWRRTFVTSAVADMATSAGPSSPVRQKGQTRS
jgi:hypothetical protein